MHATRRKRRTMVNIQFAQMPAAPAITAKAGDAETGDAEAEADAKAEAEDRPSRSRAVPKPPAKVEKNTVPLSPFGKSPKKGSENAAVAKPAPAPPAARGGTTTADVPVGGDRRDGTGRRRFSVHALHRGMHRRIGSNWFRPQVVAGAAAIVYFRIQRDGTIGEAKVETSSGNGTFDRAALSAVRSSSPLNPLPFAYDGTYLGVHLTFR
jgi:TonB family protein